MRKQKSTKYRNEVKKVNTGMNRKRDKIHSLSKERDKLLRQHALFKKFIRSCEEIPNSSFIYIEDAIQFKEKIECISKKISK